MDSELIDTTPTEPSLEGFRQILIVEDDEDLAALLSHWLHDGFTGVEIDIATTLDEATARIQSLTRLDVVLLDRRLPSGTGDTLLDGLVRRFDPVTVMITGVTPETEIIQLPISDYLVKPIDEETLVKRIALLTRLQTAGVLTEYTTARKAALLVFHLDDPDADPLFRRFAARWSYDRIEVADAGDRNYVYELYTGGANAPDRGVSISIVGRLATDVQSMWEDGDLTVIGEVIPDGDALVWLDRSTPVEPAKDGYVIYSFTGESPEQHIEACSDPQTRELERALEQAFS